MYLKLVNTTGVKQQVNLNLNGIAKVSPEATLYVIKSDNPKDTNTISDPEKIVPIMSKIKGIAPQFTQILDPYSVSLIKLQQRK